MSTSDNDTPVFSQQEDDTMTDEPVPSTPRLFTLPDGVENILLSFVVTGVGGLKGVLNLREVCKTTQSWVDNLPERQGISVFSRAQVRIDSDVETRRRFLESAPPFAVTSLSLNIASDVIVRVKNLPPDEEELWNQFYAYWAPRLETLQLFNDMDVSEDRNIRGNGDRVELNWNTMKDLNRRSLKLLEAPNLKSVSSLLFSIDESSIYSHSSRLACSEDKVFFMLSMGGKKFPVIEKSKERFYSYLENNRILKSVEIYFVIAHVSELECLGKFIEAKKNDAELEISLGMFGFPPKQNTVDFEVSNAAFVKLSKILVASKSKIRLRLHCDPGDEDDCLQTAKVLLGHKIFWLFANRVESIHCWKPTENSLPLLLDLPKIVRLDKLKLGVGANRLAEFTFPSNLMHLGFSSGSRFPTVRGLPPTLTTLKLHGVACCANDLLNSLHLLNEQCPSLEKLLINWWSYEEPSSTVTTTADLDMPKMFQKLRVLFLKGYLNEEEEADCRDVLINGLNVDHLHLFFFSLQFVKQADCVNDAWIRNLIASKEIEEFAVVDAGLLTRLCEGAMGSSLVGAYISKKSVTPDGLPVLENLESLVSANRKTRKEREGRGEWELLLRQDLLSMKGFV